MKSSPSKDRGLRILLLEDDSLDAELFTVRLGTLGPPCSVTLVTKPEQFERIFGEEEFDLIVSDSGLLGCDAVSLLDRVRQRAPHLPFIIFSGNASPQLREAALQHGATDYVCKNDFPRLLAVLRRIQTG